MAHHNSCNCKTVYYQNFTDCNLDLKCLLDVEAFDGVVGRSDLGLVVDSRRFTQSVPQGPFGRLDYYKFLACVDKCFKLDADKETTFQTWISGRQYFDADRPLPEAFTSIRADIGNIRSDPRLASSGFLLMDDKTDLFFGVVLTDRVIYGIYGRSEMAALRQQVLSGLLNDFYTGLSGTANASLAGLLGLDIDNLVLGGDSNAFAQAALLSGMSTADLGYLNSLGNFKLMANGLKGWDLDKCRKKKCKKYRKCKTDCCGIDTNALLSTVSQGAHLNFIRLGERCGDFGDLIKVGIRFRLLEDSVDWFINGARKFTLSNIGALPAPQYRGVRLCGENRCVRPCEFRFCFGTFTFLDAVRPGCLDPCLENVARQVTTVVQQALQFTANAITDQIDGAEAVVVPDIVADNVATALVPLAPLDSYCFPIANRFGEDFLPVNFFSSEDPLDPQAVRLFGQGAALIIRDLEVIECPARGVSIYEELSCNRPAIDLIEDCCEDDCDSSSSCDSSSYCDSSSSSIVCFKKVKKCKDKCKDKCEIKKIDHKSDDCGVCDRKKHKDAGYDQCMLADARGVEKRPIIQPRGPKYVKPCKEVKSAKIVKGDDCGCARKSY